MEKLSNLQVDALLKEQAEELLSRLGLPITTAVNLFLNQVVMRGGLPFEVTLPKAPLSINADLMTDEELMQKLQRGFNDAAAGRCRSAKEAFAEFMESHEYEAL